MPELSNQVQELEAKKLAKAFIQEQYIEILVFIYVYLLLSSFLQNILTPIQFAISLVIIDLGRLIQACYCPKKELRIYYYLEAFIFCLMKMCFILIVALDIRFYLMLIMFSLLLVILRLMIYCNKRKYHVFTTFQQFFNVLWKIVILVETLSISLKLDNFVTWDWIQVLWLYLILLILNGVATFGCIVYFLLRVIPDLVKQCNRNSSNLINQLDAYYFQFLLYEITIFTGNLLVYFNEFLIYVILPFLLIIITIYTINFKIELERFYANFILQIETGRNLEERTQPHESGMILQRVSTNYYRPIMTHQGQRQQSLAQNDIPSVNSEESNLCVICQDKPGEKIFMPCGHGKFCVHCIGSTETCYLCRNDINQILTVQQEHISFGIVAK